MNNQLEIHHLSNNLGYFAIYNFRDMFFCECSLESGFMPITKTVQIDKEMFNIILNDPKNFNQYSLRSQKNSELFKSVHAKRPLGSKDVYAYFKIGNKYFVDKWNLDDRPLQGKRIATEVSQEEFEKHL